MQKYIASTLKAEIVGQAILALKTSILHTTFADILEKHSLNEIDSEQWYPIQTVLDVHHEIMSHPNGTTIEVSIGMQIVENIPFPEDISLEDALNLFSSLHTQVLRNLSETDRLPVIKVNDHCFHITNDSPFPDELVYGYLYALMNRFREEDDYPTLRYLDIENINQEKSMVYEIAWESAKTKKTV